MIRGLDAYRNAEIDRYLEERRGKRVILQTKDEIREWLENWYYTPSFREMRDILREFKENGEVEVEW